MADKREELNIPQSDIESLARLILPEIHKYFESEQGKQEFEEWKKGNLKNK